MKIKFTITQEKPLSWREFFENWGGLIDFSNEEKKSLNSIFGNFVSFKKEEQKFWTLTSKEYKILTTVYHLYLSSLQKGWEALKLKKTIASLQDELSWIVKTFALDYEKFFKDIEVSEELISPIFKSRLSKIKNEIDNDNNQLQLIDTELSNKNNKDLIDKKNKILKKRTTLTKLMETEIADKKSNKVKTEMIYKILTYCGDEDALYEAINNKIKGLIRNTKLKITFNHFNTQEEFSTNLVIELVKGMKPYREKLLNGFGHSSKIMSYMDRIVRNVCLATNLKVVNDATEIYGLSWDDSSSRMDDDKDDDLFEFTDAYVEKAKDIFIENKEQNYLTFDTWKYLLKNINASSTILNNEFIRKYHTVPLLLNDSSSVKIILNQSWYYFFEKESKQYTVFWKLVTGYYDLAFHLMFNKWLSDKETFDLLFWTPTLKFWVLSFKWDTEWELILYEIRDCNFKDLFYIKLDWEDTQTPCEWHFLEYKKRFLQLVTFLYDMYKEVDKNTLIKALLSFYGIFTSTEKMFVDKLYNKLYVDHNASFINKIAQIHIQRLKEQYHNYMDYKDFYLKLKTLYKKVKRNEENYKNFIALMKETPNRLKYYMEKDKLDMSPEENILKMNIKKHLLRNKNFEFTLSELESWNYSLSLRQYLPMLWKLNSLLNIEEYRVFIKHSEEMLEHINEFSEAYRNISEETNSYLRDDITERRSEIEKQLKEKFSSKYLWGFVSNNILSDNDYLQIIKYDILNEIENENDNFLPWSQFYWMINLIS